MGIRDKVAIQYDEDGLPVAQSANRTTSSGQVLPEPTGLLLEGAGRTPKPEGVERPEPPPAPPPKRATRIPGMPGPPADELADVKASLSRIEGLLLELVTALVAGSEAEQPRSLDRPVTFPHRCPECEVIHHDQDRDSGFEKACPVHE